MRYFILLSLLLSILSSCSDTVSGYYDLPETTKDIYRFEFQAEPSSVIRAALGSYTDPGIRGILSELGTPTSLTPAAWFKAFGDAANAAGYKLAANFNKANPTLIPEKSTNEEALALLEAEYNRIQLANMERLHASFKKQDIPHNIYLSATKKVILEIAPEQDAAGIRHILTADMSKIVEFRQVVELEDGFKNVSYLMNLSETFDSLSLPKLENFWKSFQLKLVTDEYGAQAQLDWNSFSVGTSNRQDTAFVTSFISGYLDSFPVAVELFWGVTSFDPGICELYFIEKQHPDYEIDSRDIQFAEAVVDEYAPGNWWINITFSPSGSQKWAALTRQSIGESIAIVVEGNVVSAPMVDGPIEGGTAVISGSFTESEAKDLAALLNYGADAYPMVIISEGPASIK